MAPSLSQRQRTTSTVSLRSCSDAPTTTSSASALKTNCRNEEDLTVRTSAASVHSVTSNRSSRSQTRKSLIRANSAHVFNRTASSRSLGSNSRRRPESYSPIAKANQGFFHNPNKRFLLYARISVLIFILLNLTNYGMNHEQLAATTAMTIYTQATQPKLSQSLNRNTPRFLFGIFSTLRKHDFVRRKVIRRTYLASDPYRICSMKDLPNKPNCQIVYTFVVGANATGPTDLVEHRLSPLVVDPSEFPVVDDYGDVVAIEDDVTYLNLQENMEYGKSPSWFLYANTLVEEMVIDFIAKVDSDTLVFPNRFLDEFATFLPLKNHSYVGNTTTTNALHPTSSSSPELRVYGGIPNDSIGCGGLRRPHCSQMGGKTYMQGQLHFLSADLSRYVTSIPQPVRRSLFVPIEDLCTAKYVHSHPKPILEAVVSPQQQLWEHGKHIKDPQSYEQRWNEVWDEMHPNTIGRGTRGGMQASASLRVGIPA